MTPQDPPTEPELPEWFIKYKQYEQEHHEKVEPIMLFLLGSIFVFVLILVAVAKWMSTDGQTFQILGGLITGFSGAFLTRLKMPESKRKEPK